VKSPWFFAVFISGIFHVNTIPFECSEIKNPFRDFLRVYIKQKACPITIIVEHANLVKPSYYLLLCSNGTAIYHKVPVKV